MDDGEKERLERARRGDARAFEELVRPHLPSVRRFAFSFVRRWEDADDLAQEALIKAFRSFSTYEGRASLSTWLYTVTRSVGHDLLRGKLHKARGREDALPEGDELSGDRESTELSPGKLTSAKADAEALWKAIKQLDGEFRIPVVLCDIEGLSYEEVAHIERVPVGTIRSRLSRARSKIREILIAEHGFSRGSGVKPGVASSQGARST